MKPGENSNRGTNIKVVRKIEQVEEELNHYFGTVILQKYICKPLLYKGRKFDIRCFCLVSCLNGRLKAFFYEDGYIRTSSKLFSLGE